MYWDGVGTKTLNLCFEQQILLNWRKIFLCFCILLQEASEQAMFRLAALVRGWLTWYFCDGEEATQK